MAQPTDLGTVLNAGFDEIFPGSRSSLPSTLVIKLGQILLDTDTGNFYSGNGTSPLSSLPVAGSSVFTSLNPQPATYTYNVDQTVATETIAGVATVYTYNVDQTVATSTRSGVTRVYVYNPDGTIASVT